jgi:hypothetical protein
MQKEKKWRISIKAKGFGKRVHFQMFWFKIVTLINIAV